MSPEDERRLERDRRTLRAPELAIERHRPTRGQKTMRFDAPTNVAVAEQDLPGMGIPEGVTRVISARGLDPVPTLAKPGHVYVGREIEARGRCWPKSPFANPFNVDDRVADRGLGAHHICVNAYAEYLFHLAHMRGKRGDILALKGATLICWCTPLWTPERPVTTPCHAIVLAMLAEGLVDFKDLADRSAMAEKFWGYKVTT